MTIERYGMIAGNGRFPILALESARSLGHQVVVIAIKEEAPKEVEALASRCYWISLGELSRLIDICKREKIQQVMMCGQVKHVNIFSAIRPDWRLIKLLASLDTKNTESLIGGVARVLESEGVRLTDSTVLLKSLLASGGVLSRRAPSKAEQKDIDYGRSIAHALAGFDIGQSVAICERACVALEAMEGTDEMLQRAAALVRGRPLTLVKAATRRRHLLFDVPVVGPQTIRTMQTSGATALAIDAGRTLLLDCAEMLRLADAASIAVIACAPLEQRL